MTVVHRTINSYRTVILNRGMINYTLSPPVTSHSRIRATRFHHLSRVLLRSYCGSITTPDLPRTFCAKSVDSLVSSTPRSSTQNCLNSPVSINLDISASSASPCPVGLQSFFAIFFRPCVVVQILPTIFWASLIYLSVIRP